ncbi:sarcosine oxidase subunit gamma [Pseudonocardia spinosispora]|uniref:sarcosine oxidase subunit gamma n=1 Tax=Pseudonocardia spinosispora TaxID=103441 RepID=UPI00040DACF1|nr:sarcosine oxidase subunit gamma family protein [Pseudonocardia spinosispora]
MSRSPIALTVGGRTTELTLADASALVKFSVRASMDSTVLSTPFGRAQRHPSLGLVVGSGPGEWLVLAAPDSGPGPRAELDRIAAGSGEFVSVVELTHGRALVRLRGADSASLLAKLCAVDLSDAVTPNGAAFRSSVARITTDVVRDDDGGVRSYLLHCERSSGQYLAECLLDAGTEFAIEVDAFTPTDWSRS